MDNDENHTIARLFAAMERLNARVFRLERFEFSCPVCSYANQAHKVARNPGEIYSCCNCKREFILSLVEVSQSKKSLLRRLIWK